MYFSLVGMFETAIENLEVKVVIAIFSLSFCKLEFSVKRDKIYTEILRYCPCEQTIVFRFRKA